MGSGISIFLIATGAVLYFAVTKVVDGLNLGAVGVILMLAGGLGLVVSLVVLGMTRTRTGRTTIVTPVQTRTAVVDDQR